MQVEVELKRTITTLESTLMDALSSTNAMAAKMKALEEQVDTRVIEATRNIIVMRDAKIKALKLSVVKWIPDAKEVENILKHLEN